MIVRMNVSSLANNRPAAISAQEITWSVVLFSKDILFRGCSWVTLRYAFGCLCFQWCCWVEPQSREFRLVHFRFRSLERLVVMTSRFLVLMLPGLLFLPGDVETTAPDGTPAIVFDSIGGSGGGLTVNATDGWEFSVEKPLTVTALGTWDYKLDGFATDIPVGLWNSQGMLLATARVPAGKAATEVDGFRYVGIGPVQLQPGHGYVIGAAYTPQTKENVAGGNSGAKFFSDGSIRWERRRRVINQPGLAFPELAPERPGEVLLPGGFGPNFLIAAATTPRIYYRTHKVAEPHNYAMVKLPESSNGFHSRDLVVFVSLFARKNGELTQILINGEPLGTGTDALKSVAGTVRMLVAGVTKTAGVRPDIRIAAPSWLRYSDLTKVVDACSGRVRPYVSRTQTLNIELSTLRDTGIPLVNADVEGRFINKGECIEDTWTGLLWQKDGSASGRKNFTQAAEYAANLKLNGLTGWRVPTIEELASVFPADDTPFVETGYVPANSLGATREHHSYWTSELDTRGEDYAFVYHWYDKGGANNCYASRNFVRVRCVRDVDPVDSAAASLVSHESAAEPPTIVQTGRQLVVRRNQPGDHAAPPLQTASASSGDPRKRRFAEFLRNNVIGRTIFGKVTTGIDQDRLESVFERRTTFTRFLESDNGFGFDEVIDIRETIRPRDNSKKNSVRTRQDNRRVILRHQYSIRKSTGEMVGYAREVSHNEGQLSTAAVIKRAVMELNGQELLVRTTTVGYDDHVTADGSGPGAVQSQSKFSVIAGLLQRSQANENFSVNADSLVRKPNRRETELIVDVEVK